MSENLLKTITIYEEGTAEIERMQSFIMKLDPEVAAPLRESLEKIELLLVRLSLVGVAEGMEITCEAFEKAREINTVS